MLIIWLGGALVIAGLLYLAARAIWGGRMSAPAAARPKQPKDTLEPPQNGFRFLAFNEIWPGLAMMAAGAILLLLGGII